MTSKYLRRLVPVLAAMLLLAACGKKEPAAAATATDGTNAPAATAAPAGSGDPTRDYKVPYLDDAKMGQFIQSLQEEKNPFEILFKAGGMANMSQLQKEMESFNAYARKFGFKGYEDYMAVWGRITVAEISVAAVQMKKGAIDMIAGLKKNAEEQLKRTDLSVDERKSYEEQVADNAKSLADLQKPDEGSLSAQDMAVYLKYKAQIDEAVKKYRKQPVN